MTIDIAKLKNGSMAVVSNEPLPGTVKHVEYFKEQRLFQLVFDNDHAEELLIPEELSDESARFVQSAPDMMVVVLADDAGEPYGYDVPLIQIGV